MVTQETKYGANGEKMTAYYLDGNWVPCDKSKSTIMEIVVYDKDGRFVQSVIGFTKNSTRE